MRPIGFSTGAIAKSNLIHGVAHQYAFPELRAIELSALREHELVPLIHAARELDLSQFAYISVHAPSNIGAMGETQMYALLDTLPVEWHIVAHPNILQTRDYWKALGSRLCIENMDGRKARGRTTADLRELFDLYPEAGFCLDVGHARQIDPTMAEAASMIAEFGSRLQQIHISEVDLDGKHLALSDSACDALRSVVSKIDPAIPAIIESVINVDDMSAEMQRVASVFEQ